MKLVDVSYKVKQIGAEETFGSLTVRTCGDDLHSSGREDVFWFCFIFYDRGEVCVCVFVSQGFFLIC